MTTRLTFTIRGEPRGKGRARALPRIVWENGEPQAVVRMVTPPDTAEAEAEVRAAFRKKYPKHRLWTGPVMLRFTAVFATPKSFNKALQRAAAEQKLYATKKPDKDNIEKLITDALNGVVWADDSQVMGGGIKRYGSPARIDVVLELIDTAEIPATPGQIRTERAIGARDQSQPELALFGIKTKSEKKHPPALQQRIDDALARGTGTAAPPRTTTAQYRNKRK